MKPKNKITIYGTIIAKDENNPLPNYSLKNAIGEGTFGKVYLGIHNMTNEKVAIKILEKAKILENEEIERINREIKFLKKLKNINIIKIYEIIETKTNVYFVMEYASGGELYNYIVNNRKLEEKESSFFFAQVVYALEFIHKNNIVHRDIKPENMLLTENKTIKLIDFGLSNQYSKNSFLKTPCGSPCYAAPEMILGMNYKGQNIDIWSLGITLYAMVCGYLPFEDKNNDKLYKKILDCRLEFPNYLSDSVKDMIKRLLTVNPKKRISIEEIKQHSFFKLSMNMINKNILGLYLKKVDNYILERMGEIGFNKNQVIKEVESNNHNNITTTYELLLNKYKGIGDVNIIENESKDKLKLQIIKEKEKEKEKIIIKEKEKEKERTSSSKKNKDSLTKNTKEFAPTATLQKDNNDKENLINKNEINNFIKQKSPSNNDLSSIDIFELEKKEFILKNSKTGIESYIADAIKGKNFSDSILNFEKANKCRKFKESIIEKKKDDVFSQNKEVNKVDLFLKNFAQAVIFNSYKIEKEKKIYFNSENIFEIIFKQNPKKIIQIIENVSMNNNIKIKQISKMKFELDKDFIKIIIDIIQISVRESRILKFSLINGNINKGNEYLSKIVNDILV